SSPLSVVRAAGGERRPLPGTDREFDVAELRRLVEDHHGRFTVTPAPPAGTIYAASLPLRAVDLPRAPPLIAAPHASIAGRRVPAIALTGRAEAADRTRALLAGYQAHLAKPADPEGLVATIASLLPPAEIAPAIASR